MSKKSILDPQTRADRKKSSLDRLAIKASKQVKLPAAAIPLSRTIRETVESIVIAFILAFLFRTFEAEAFVIPTGSMAPTLQGMHKELNCPNCNFRYKVSASSESGEKGPVLSVTGATCPNCRFPADHITKPNGYKTYNGDRILVSKFAYEFSEPKRWDVFVFRFPGDAKMNYIKRLVGLPNETLMIEHGDLYRRPLDAKNPAKHENTPFEILRKPPSKVRAMLQMVYDNDYLQLHMHQRGWPKRWQVVDPTQGGEGAWKEIDQGKAFQADGKHSGRSWIRYYHIVPTQRAWNNTTNDALPGKLARTSLIADYYGYNTGRPGQMLDRSGNFWVGDLGLECEIESSRSQGTVTLQLVEGGYRFECLLNLELGKAALSINGSSRGFIPSNNPPAGNDSPKLPESLGKVISSGSHQVRFANVDDQLLLWIDDRLVEFDHPTAYAGVANHQPSRADPDDRVPVAIGTAGAAIRVSHLKVLRDVYYIAQKQVGGRNSFVPEYELDQREDFIESEFLSDPSQWGQDGPFDRRREQFFDIGSDQFFAMGDNSPASSDSRLWGDSYKGIPPVVDRHLLIGKALYIYWPRSLDYFPFCPNFPRMGFVR